MEFTMQKFEQKADEKVKTQEQNLAQFDETIQGMQQNIEIMNSNVSKCEKSIDDTI